MDTMSAFVMGQANRGKEQMVFDWDKAATLIRERNAQSASAGLSGDWEWTGDQVLADGKPIPSDSPCTYLASTWATPELDIDGDIVDCYRMQSEVPEWNCKTYWPDSALAILNATPDEQT